MFYPDLLVRYLHFIGIFTWLAALVAEAVLLKPVLPRRTIRQLANIDRLYGMSAILVVAMGLLLWLKVGKPAEFYNNNPIFHAKVGMAILVGILSIYPTVFFIRQAKGEDVDTELTVPLRVRQLVYLQLFLMAIIPLLATLMAGGIGA